MFRSILTSTSGDRLYVAMSSLNLVLSGVRQETIRMDRQRRCQVFRLGRRQLPEEIQERLQYRLPANWEPNFDVSTIVPNIRHGDVVTMKADDRMDAEDLVFFYDDIDRTLEGFIGFHPEIPFSVPMEFPPYYWKDALPESRVFPSFGVFDQSFFGRRFTQDDLYLSEDGRYIVLPTSIRGTVYYIVVLVTKTQEALQRLEGKPPDQIGTAVLVEIDGVIHYDLIHSVQNRDFLGLLGEEPLVRIGTPLPGIPIDPSQLIGVMGLVG